MSVVSAAVALLVAPGVARGTPSGPHPRIWIDAATRAAWQAQSSVASTAAARAVARCAEARSDPGTFAEAGYQGFGWAEILTSCLVAREVTGSDEDAATALVYFGALLDDYDTVGDGAGGDDVVTHDTGYAMRTFAPYAALAYDWLHDAPAVTDAFREHARALRCMVHLVRRGRVPERRPRRELPRRIRVRGDDDRHRDR